MSDNSVTLDEIRNSYTDHPGYQHWFWEWFAQADLDEDLIKQFALMYYQHVLRFRLYIAGALTVAPSEKLQVALSEILADEYGVHLAAHPPADSHPEMFRKFMLSAGLTEADWSDGTPIPGVQYFFDSHFAMFRGELVSESLGAVAFGMETTTPYRHAKVLEGLAKYEKKSGVSLDVAFFSSHVQIDEHHSSILYDTAMPVFTSDPKGVMRGARYSFDAREVFLDDLGARLGATR
ncbi:iron-containing redox enzyme family protein [Streptomyces microflavus]|uniref:iron-containing redox enzyme family protein n=1 Tax=Streptomyces microflavus TaxID=1919 RepID=UPI0035E08490